MISSRTSFLLKTATVLAAALLVLAMAEVTFRLLDYDLDGETVAFRKVPIFYRMPTEPVGEVFFRRPGPAAWKGNVLSAGYEAELGAPDHNYENWPEVTVTYDRQGFRNPDDLNDWEVVVVGDSFTELGYLPYEELFTTQLAKLLGVRVKNLGVSYTGTIAQSFYLKEYGKAPSTRHAVLVFFEGNDLWDILEEQRLLREFRATGNRPYRNLKKQTSLFKMLGHLATRAYEGLKSKPAAAADPFPPNAYYLCHTATPITLDYLPPGRAQLTAEQVAGLDEALADWAETARALGMKPWLVYMPCKLRALNGCLKFLTSTKRAYIDWRPTDLPELVKELAGKDGMEFIDVTPALAAEARAGNLPYNPVWDTHLNPTGCRAAAQTIADALGRTAGN